MNKKLVLSYIATIEELHEKGVILPAEVLIHLLQSVTNNHSVASKFLCFFNITPLGSIQAFYERLLAEDNINYANLQSMIINIDHYLSKFKRAEIPETIMAMWAAFFSVYPHVYIPTGTRIELDHDTNDKRPVSLLRYCWKVAKLVRDNDFKQIIKQIEFILKSDNLGSESVQVVKQVMPYLDYSAREQIVNSLIAYCNIMNNITIELADLIGCAASGLANDKHITISMRIRSELMDSNKHPNMIFAMPYFMSVLDEKTIDKALHCFFGRYEFAEQLSPYHYKHAGFLKNLLQQLPEINKQKYFTLLASKFENDANVTGLIIDGCEFATDDFKKQIQTYVEASGELKDLLISMALWPCKETRAKIEAIDIWPLHHQSNVVNELLAYIAPYFQVNRLLFMRNVESWWEKSDKDLKRIMVIEQDAKNNPVMRPAICVKFSKTILHPDTSEQQKLHALLGLCRLRNLEELDADMNLQLQQLGIPRDVRVLPAFRY